MKKPTFKAVVLYGLLLAGCGDQNVTDSMANAGIERFGLFESTVDHPLVLSAIEIANAVVHDHGQKFAPGWEFDRPSTAMPIYAARGRLASREIMSIYSECGCIIVQVGKLDAWLEAKVGSGPALLAIEPRLILAYMLLHEAGHIEGETSVESTSRSGMLLPAKAHNRDPAAQKEREKAADAFAAEVIKSGLDEGSNRGLAAAGVAMGLSQLAWNLAEHRLLDDFGGTVLGKPSLFLDAGTSHPNLEWRVLSVNNQIAGSDVSRQLLEDFEKSREARPGSILWPPAK